MPKEGHFRQKFCLRITTTPFFSFLLNILMAFNFPEELEQMKKWLYAITTIKLENFIVFVHVYTQIYMLITLNIFTWNDVIPHIFLIGLNSSPPEKPVSW